MNNDYSDYYQDYYDHSGSLLPPHYNKETCQEKLHRVLSKFELEDVENYLRVKKIEKLKQNQKTINDAP